MIPLKTLKTSNAFYNEIELSFYITKFPQLSLYSVHKTYLYNAQQKLILDAYYNAEFS